MSTAEIGLSVRTTNCLEERGIFTVSDLLNCTPEDLLAISNFGEKTLEEVYKALEGIGFYRKFSGETRPAAGDARPDGPPVPTRCVSATLPWPVTSATTKKNGATGEPAPGPWAASARPSSSPSCWCSAAAGILAGHLLAGDPRVAGQSRLRRDHLHRAAEEARREQRATPAPCIGPRSRSSTRSTARPTARTTTSVRTSSGDGATRSDREGGRRGAGAVHRGAEVSRAGTIRPIPTWPYWSAATSGGSGWCFSCRARSLRSAPADWSTRSPLGKIGGAPRRHGAAGPADRAVRPRSRRAGPKLPNVPDPATSPAAPARSWPTACR